MEKFAEQPPDCMNSQPTNSGGETRHSKASSAFHYIAKQETGCCLPEIPSDIE